MLNLIRILILVSTIVAIPLSVRADIAIDVNSEGSHFNGNWTLGFEFIANHDIELVSLGFFDDGADGLTDSHDVAIWDSSGNLIASVTVDPSDPLTGKFRYATIAPVTLTGGTTYIIGGHNYLNDAAIRNDLGVTGFVHSDINITAGRWVNGGLSFPSNRINDSNVFYNTVSFEFHPASVPEPVFSAVLMSLIVLAWCWGCRRRTVMV